MPDSDARTTVGSHYRSCAQTAVRNILLRPAVVRVGRFSSCAACRRWTIGQEVVRQGPACLGCRSRPRRSGRDRAVRFRVLQGAFFLCDGAGRAGRWVVSRLRGRHPVLLQRISLTSLLDLVNSCTRPGPIRFASRSSRLKRRSRRTTLSRPNATSQSPSLPSLLPACLER